MNTDTNTGDDVDAWQFPVNETPSREVTSRHTLDIETLIWGSSDVSEGELFYDYPNAGTHSVILECASCHDPHEYDQTYRMLRKQPGGSPIAYRGSDIFVYVTDQLAYAEHNDSDILNYTTDDYTEVDYAAPDVYDASGNLVEVTYAGGDPMPKYSQQISKWCASCHGRYHRKQTGHRHAGSVDSGDAIYAYGHKTGDAMVSGTETVSCGYDGTACHGEPNSINVNKQLICLGCHVAHGTAAQMDARITEMPWPGQDLPDSNVPTDEHLDYGWDLDQDSRSNLLRLDNRGVCQNSYCHPKGTGAYLEGHSQGMDGGPSTDPLEDDECQVCHENEDAHDGTGDMDCASCHAGDGGGGDGDDCASCHSSTLSDWDNTGHGKTTGNYVVSDNPAADLPGAANGENSCLYCHDSSVPHSSGTNPFRLNNTQNEDCLICHESSATGYDPDDAGPMSAKNATVKVNSSHYGSKHDSGNNGGQFCWDCHDPHGDSNLVMIHDEVSKTSTTDYGRPTSPVATTFISMGTWESYVNNSPSDGICQVCHTSTSRYTGSTNYDPSHNPGLSCTMCHTHDNGFSAGGGSGGECTACHIVPVGSRSAIAPGDWTASSHEDTGCLGCHAEDNTHMDGTVQLSAGADPDVYLASETGATGGAVDDLDQFCFECHTDGMVQNDALSGAALADSIEDAFSTSRTHDMGTTFSIEGDTFTNQCTSCHNPHVVTGKHWEVDTPGISPVTKPDFNDPANNPRGMGATLWGDGSGEKMDDFAAQGPGTGGWYYSKARGGVVSFDQPAVYQPPKTEGAGWENHEFDGDVLPDYTSLCLDCHTYRMSPANPPVNWGQPGVTPTGNSVDPPDQRIEAGAQHGLNAANRPSYWGDVGLYGNSGNPDPIFNEPGVTRGRGAGHFMRWPYDSAYRNAGINFVLSCTDCHEAHGSNTGSMLRSDPNDGTGTTIWNTMCNNCHYYYGGQHAGMSCGNASCHEANSVHRIIHNTESGSTNLWTEPSRPATTPEVVSVEGSSGSAALRVTFTEGVGTNMDGTGALLPEDFLLTDTGNDNPRSILSVAHTPGDITAIVTMSADLILADVDNDILATRGISVWDASGEPAGPWPVTISAAASPIGNASGVVGHEKLAVWFSQRVYANSDTSGALQPSDFEFVDAGAGKNIMAVDHIPGDVKATLTLSDTIEGADLDTATVAAADGAIYDITGYSLPITPRELTTDAAYVSSISGVEGIEGSDKLKVTFQSQVYANDDETGALQISDFSYTNGNGGGATAISGVSHTAGSSIAIITLDTDLILGDIGSDTVAAASDSIFGPSAGNFPLGTGAVTISGQAAPVITRVEGVVGYIQLLVSFSQGVYAENNRMFHIQLEAQLLSSLWTQFWPLVT
jgi:predicted CXXCH cytochrome family protein